MKKPWALETLLETEEYIFFKKISVGINHSSEKWEDFEFIKQAEDIL